LRNPPIFPFIVFTNPLSEYFAGIIIDK